MNLISWSWAYLSFFSSTIMCFAGSVMVPISFHANSCILEASNEGMVLFVPKGTEIQDHLPQSLQVKWNKFNSSSLPVLFSTWLHTGFINLLWILDPSVVSPSSSVKELRLTLVSSCWRWLSAKSQTSSLDLKASRTRALIIFLIRSAIWAVHMPVTSVKNLFELLKLAPFEMQGTFMFAMRHSLLFPPKLAF